MASIASAQKITGLKVTVERDLFGFTATALDGNLEYARITACKTQANALDRLVAAVYRLRCQAALKRAGYRCERCKTMGVLHVHHRQKRSHGRLDTLDNLEVLCLAHHEAEHRPAPGMRKAAT